MTDRTHQNKASLETQRFEVLGGTHQSGSSEHNGLGLVFEVIQLQAMSQQVQWNGVVIRGAVKCQGERPK